MRSTIICVDDEKMILNILADQLESWFGSNYNIEKALGGEEALEILDEYLKGEKEVSCVISDYIMPVIKGDELLEKVKERDPKIRKIMLTGYSSIDGIVSAINRAGLYRYITKPWDSRDLMLTVIEAIKSYEQEREAVKISKGFETLYKKYESLYIEQEKKFNAAIEALVKAVELAEPSLAGVSKRVSEYCETIAKLMNMPEADIKTLKLSALLHNIGRLVSTPEQTTENNDFILKQQILSSEQILSNMLDSNKILAGIKYQYEKYNGSGIFNLNEDQIPLEARIIALAKFYDRQKCNKNAPARPSVAEQMISLKGIEFDPIMVDKLVEDLYNKN